MRKKIIAGNWKMHLNKAEAIELVESVLVGSKDLDLDENKIVVFSPSFVYLDTIVSKIASLSNVFVAAQNCSEYE
ncbi:MAG TPA: triose-phosphate isomerase, partial [Chitinophagales bacterium]|nr:triose-phosphate isomerase [Chitinophagales bacterium]